MKKILISILIIAMVVAMGITVNAETQATASVQVSLEGPTSIDEETKTISVIIKLGNFTNLAENKVMGYETVLQYNENVVKSVKVEGLNDWKATYSSDTKRIIGEVDEAKANVEIAKITYELNDLTNVEEVKITVSDFNITDDDVLDQTTTLNQTITVNKQNEDDGITNEIGNEIANEIGNEVSNEISNNMIDNTTKKETLPEAGLGNVLAPIILIICLVGIACIAKSESIKLK